MVLTAQRADDFQKEQEIKEKEGGGNEDGVNYLAQRLVGVRSEIERKILYTICQVLLMGI